MTIGLPLRLPVDLTLIPLLLIPSLPLWILLIQQRPVGKDMVHSGKRKSFPTSEVVD